MNILNPVFFDGSYIHQRNDTPQFYQMHGTSFDLNFQLIIIFDGYSYH